jgi:serine/threonine protein kinase/Tol biopolymer transport system component
MSQANLDRVKRIFHQLMEAAEPERERLLDTLCGEDDSLRGQVVSLLAADAAGSDILSTREIEEVHAGQAAPPAEPEQPIEGPGSRIGPYKLLQVIGEGGFGVVYMAEQEAPIRRRVALKVVKPGMDTKQVIARFEAERQALAILDHPNIAKVFEAGTTPTGRPYFVMELVRGIPITEYCDEQRLDTKERLALFADVCGAVHHAHKHGIIHRDIKPSNILVTLHDGTPVPMVIDFGIAKATHQRLTERTLFTEFNQFIGTPAYMAPEQAAYEGLDVDGRSDVYSLGVLLYELLTGTPPFDTAVMKRAAYDEILRILKEEEPPKPSTRISAMGAASATNASRRRLDTVGLVRLLRGDLDWIVMKALEKDRRRRYESAAEMAGDISRYFNHQPILARRPSRIYRARKLFRRRRGPFMAAAVTVLALVADVAYVSWQRHQAPAGAGTSGMPATQIRRLLMSDAGCYLEGIRPSPDGTRLAYGDNCTDGALYVRDLASGETRRVTDEGFYLGAVWSPDGTKLAAMNLNAGFYHPGEPFSIIDLRSGAVETPDVLKNTWFSPRDWSPDGQLLSGVRENGDKTSSSVVVSLRTGEFITLASAVNAGEGLPTFSPDGRYVAFSDHIDGNQDVYVMDLSTRERVRVTSAPESEGYPLWSPDGGLLAYQGRGGLWAVGMTDGRPDAGAYLVGDEGGWQSSWVKGGYFFSTSHSLARAYRIPVDLGTARVTGPAEAFPEADGHGRFAWSPDGGRVAAADWFGDWSKIYVADEHSETAFPVGDEIQTTKLWWSSDGREILFTSKTLAQRDKRQTVYVLNPSDGSMRELFPRLDSIAHIHVSPDGRKMVFHHGDYASIRQELRISDLGNPDGLVLATGDHPDGPFSGMFGQPLFSPGGSQIAFLRQQQLPQVHTSSLWVVPADGSREPRLLVRAPLIQRIIWHPNSRFIAFERTDPKNHTGRSIYVVSLETGEVQQVVDLSESEETINLNHWSPDGRWIGYSELQGTMEYWMVKDPLAEALGGL